MVDLPRRAGDVVAVPLGALARWRSGKPMHPRGAVFDAELERWGCTPAGRRPPALRTPPASLCISTLRRPPPAVLGTVLLHSAHIIHACPATKL